MEQDQGTPDDGFPVDRNLLRALLAHVEEIVLTARADGTLTFVSPASRLLLGYDPRELEGQNLLSFVHPDERDEVVEALVRWTDRSGTPRGQVQHIRTSEGTYVPFMYDVVIGPWTDAVGGLVVTLRPSGRFDDDRRAIWQRMLNEDRLVRLATVFLRRSYEQFDEALHEAVDELAGLEWITRVSVWARDRADPTQLVRRAAWAARANAPLTPLPPAIPAGGTTLLRRIAAGEEVHLRSVDHLPDDWAEEREALRASGVRSLLAVPMTVGKEVTGFVLAEVTFADATFDVTQVATLRSAAAILASGFHRHETEEEMARAARTDRLTGLPNRWAFLDAVATTLSTTDGAGRAVTLVDIDEFHLVNDAFGHDVGDRVLVAVAERLRRALHADDTLYCLHGDEFLVLATGIRDAAQAAERITPLIDALTPPFDARGHPVQLTATAGVVLATGSESGTELIQRADLVMQQTRTLGSARIGTEGAALHLLVAERLQRQSELRAALEQGAIEAYYQGEWDLTADRLVGAEALARWHHPDDGVVEAHAFIDLAEDSGLITPLGATILGAACDAASSWPADLVIRVNISARQLHEDDVFTTVSRTLERTGLASDRLCLELTETALLADPTHAVGILDAIRSLGVGLAIDDFGTGYSSLLYLKRLPVTAVKIDRSFVAGLPDNDDDRAIVRSVVQLAGTLGITVTAEGVETDAQRQCLLDLGCTRAQGFLLSRPEPADAFAARFHRDASGSR